MYLRDITFDPGKSSPNRRMFVGGGTPETIDRLACVPNHPKTCPGPRYFLEEESTRTVHILIFIDQNVAIGAPQCVSHIGVRPK